MEPEIRIFNTYFPLSLKKGLGERGERVFARSLGGRLDFSLFSHCLCAMQWWGGGKEGKEVEGKGGEGVEGGGGVREGGGGWFGEGYFY